MLVDKPLMGAQINWAHPLSRGLVGCWLFNEGSGDKVYDLSLNGNSGTLNGFAFPPTVTSGWNLTRTGIGLAFDGINDYVNCGNNPSLNLINAITIEAWVKESKRVSIAKIVVRRGTTYPFWFLGCDEGYPYASVSDGSSHTPVTAGSVIPLDTWQHIVMTYDDADNEIKIYVNGVGKTETTTKTYPGSDDDVWIGKPESEEDPFNGTIDEVRLYNRALTANEILQLYYEPYAMFEPTYEEALLYSAPPVGLSIPVAMHHYAQMRA